MLNSTLVCRAVRLNAATIFSASFLASVSLSRRLSGQISPKLQHALLIAIGLGMTPADFFEVAYPDLRGSRTRHPLAQKLKAAEGWTVHQGPVDDELDERIEAAVERALQRRNT